MMRCLYCEVIELQQSKGISIDWSPARRAAQFRRANRPISGKFNEDYKDISRRTALSAISGCLYGNLNVLHLLLKSGQA